MKKRNNKGFSLVELIVVVLIMAVIAVVLAPQIMKWVENSRLSTDNQNLNQMVSNTQLALAKEKALKEVIGKGDTTITIAAGAATYSPSYDATGDFVKELTEITGTFPSTSSSSAAKFVITIDVEDGKIKNVTGVCQDSSGAAVDLDVD